ncbi:di-trans,poly-cis-decaprenylcistransferase, partial [Heyndrickxia oleronia]
QKDIRICVLGDINGLPIHTREAVKKAVDQTSNNSKLIVNFALNYGGRSEILSAIKSLINDINNSKIADSGITGDLIENYLYTKGQPEPDIVIRTGGEKRMSNFLLWQSSKSEWWFTDTLFPEFDSKQLLQAINEVNQRKDINIS